MRFYDRVFVGSDPVNLVDPWGLFQFGYRDLPVVPQVPLPSNLSTKHEHGFYDNGRDVGYFPTGIGPDDSGATKQDYDMFGPYYDDNIMAQAEQNLRNSGNWEAANQNEPWYSNSDPNDYDLTTDHNCQDFADALREEYKRLGGRTCSIPFTYGAWGGCLGIP